MNIAHKFFSFFLMILIAVAIPCAAQTTDYETIAAAQAAANAKPGLRHVPECDIPIPTDGFSAQEQIVIGAPYLPIFNVHPKNSAEWKELVIWRQLMRLLSFLCSKRN